MRATHVGRQDLARACRSTLSQERHRSADPVARRADRRRQPVHAQDRAQPPGQYRRARRSTRRATASPGSRPSARWRRTSSSSTGKCRCSTAPSSCASCARPACSRCPTSRSSCSAAHGERWRVVEAARIGVNEYLRKPVSAQALLDRLIVDPRQAAPDGAARRLLRPGAAQAGSPIRSREPSSRAGARRHGAELI